MIAVPMMFFAFYLVAILCATIGAAFARPGWEDLPADGPVRIIPIVVPMPNPAPSVPAPVVRWAALEAVAAQVATRTLIRSIVRDLQAEC